MRRSIIMLLLITAMGCSKNDKNEPITRHVIKHTGPQSVDIYAMHNFILLDSAVYYFFKEPSKYVSCGTGLDGRPERLHLTPDSLKRIPLSTLSTFLRNGYAEFKQTLQIENINSQYASISSPSDTIKNSAFDTLYNFCKANNLRYITIRNWTEEEQFVTLAKIHGQKYEPDSIKWKTGFDPLLEKNFEDMHPASLKSKP